MKKASSKNKFKSKGKRSSTDQADSESRFDLDSVLESYKRRKLDAPASSSAQAAREEALRGFRTKKRAGGVDNNDGKDEVEAQSQPPPKASREKATTRVSSLLSIYWNAI